MKITEEVLAAIGFVQQNPPTIWDYEAGTIKFRFSKSNYAGANAWRLQCGNDHPVVCPDVITAMVAISIHSREQGVQETQNKLHDALGLNRLVEQVVYRLQD